MFQRKEMRVELLLPPQHHKLSSHCLGPSPGAAVIAAVWHSGEYFAFLLSQENFPSLSVTLSKIKHASKSVVSIVTLRLSGYVRLFAYQAQNSNGKSSNVNEVQSTDTWMRR